MSADQRPASLYVHVPFCARRCAYCDFAVQATAAAPTEDWLRTVTGEMGLLADEHGWESPLRLDTVYVGGGTPSMLAPEAMGEFRERLSRWAVWDDAAEWTCEANPESFTPEVAAAWRQAGVKRLSLGAQTFHPATLRWMGRLHGPEGPSRAMGIARQAGFEDVSVDLIFGVPARLGRDWAADLYHALSLEPQHVSLYGLTAEAGAPLGRWVAEGRETLADEDRYADEFLMANRTLSSAGFVHYEVSNFGLPGRFSRHNRVYWQGEPYAALGPGAHAFLPPQRRWNVRGWSEYRDAVDAGRLPLDGQETIDTATAALEAAWLGLRTVEGVSLAETGVEPRRLAAEWVDRGLAVLTGTQLRLTAEGWLLLDRLAVDLAAAQEESHKPASPLT